MTYTKHTALTVKKFWMYYIRFVQQATSTVRFAVGRPGIHSLSRVISKDFKKSYLQVPSQHKKELCGEQAGGLLVDAFIFMWQTGGLPVLYRVTIVELFTQHVARGNSGVPNNGSLPRWW